MPETKVKNEITLNKHSSLLDVLNEVKVNGTSATEVETKSNNNDTNHNEDINTMKTQQNDSLKAITKHSSLLDVLGDDEIDKTSTITKTNNINNKNNKNKNEDINTIKTQLKDSLITIGELKEELYTLTEENENIKQRIQILEDMEKDHERKIDTGELMSGKKFENIIIQLQNKLKEEISKRKSYEKEICKIGSEYELLSEDLFEKAKEMVRIEKIQNSKYEKEIRNKDIIIESQQQQLRELKENIYQEAKRYSNSSSSSGSATSTAMRLERISTGGTNTNHSSFSSPISARGDLSIINFSTDLSRFNTLRGSQDSGSSLFEYSINNGQLNLKYDISTFNDFVGIAYVANRNLAKVLKSKRGPDERQNSIDSSISSTDNSTALNLKESKFVRRCLVDDVEPTLRLDLAPGFSWMTRRSLMTLIVNGGVVVEPISGRNESVVSLSRVSSRETSIGGLTSGSSSSTNLSSMSTPCCLCGEAREDLLEHKRLHMMSITGSKDTHYPLCSYCLQRMRSVCEFFSFLRQLRDGVFRCYSEEEQQKAWVECTRLRQNMFWARIGVSNTPENIAKFYGNEEELPRDEV